MTTIRRPPIEAVYALHVPRERGKCRWCGLPQAELSPIRNQVKAMHAACTVEIQIIRDPTSARRAVWRRDAGKCSTCDAPPRSEDRPRNYGLSTPTIVTVDLWHVDHKIPLWKVAHMPPEQRIEYFKLPNLVTLCTECHERKTAKEASERAHFNHLSEPQEPKFKRKWPEGRKMQSRPFPKPQSAGG